ncbi:hypothetical protein V6N13_033114 [Hibiscus sabdariffa]
MNVAVAAPTVTAARNQVQLFSVIAMADPNANFKNPLANVFFDDTRNAANICLPNYSPCTAGFMCCSNKCLKLGAFSTVGFCGV